MKICSKCKVEKPFDQFYIDRRSKTGYTSRCRGCANEASKDWYRKSPEYRQIIRNSGLKTRFGIDQDDYFQMLEDQGGVCYICEEKPEGYLHVDHNHKTGEVRGLLCKSCNHGLGNFRDNIAFLKNAIKYLDKNSVGNF